MRNRRSGGRIQNATADNQRRNLKSVRFASRSLPAQEGFTLLEIMVAISIIAIVLVSIYRMHAQTLSMNYAAKFYATAPMLAQKKMAEINLENQQDIIEDSGDFGDEFPGYRWKRTIDDVESSTLGEPANRLMKIDILVSLNNDEYTYGLIRYRYFQN